MMHFKTKDLIWALSTADIDSYFGELMNMSLSCCWFILTSSFDYRN